MKKLTTFLKVFTVLIVFFFHVPTVWGQIFEENFDYPIGSLLNANGWTAHSGTGTQEITVTDGLFFDGYAGSNIGGSALLDNNGEDVHRTFTAQSAGAVYTAFIIQTESSNSAGYFLHLGQSTIGTTFFTRVWVNATGSGLGLGSSTAPTSYVPITAGIPTLVVTKFDIAAKVSSLFVFNSFPENEPLTPDFTFTETATFTNVGCIALRQYNVSERVIVDGIRIATNWDDAVTASGGPPSVAAPTFNPAAGIYFTSQEVTISTTTENATIYYTTDGSEPTQLSTPFTDPINITSTTTLKARAYATGLDPSIIAQGTYTIPVVNEVANLAELRAAFPLTDYFKVTGDVVLTFQQTFRGQKYIQDATGAILIDDLSGKITSTYNVGDGITGIIGTIAEFGNMLQFVPAFDPGAATSTGNQIVPQEITIAEMTANFNDYESQLVKIVNATFADGGAAFENGLPYAISDDSKATGNFRTTFYDVDYIGTMIPSGAGNIVGIPNSRTDGDFITARSLSDLEWYYGEPTNYPTAFEAIPDGSSIKLTWADATGEILPTGYLILASDEDNIVTPVDGASVANDPDLSDGTGAMNVAFGAEEYIFASLPYNVTYYFKIFSYTGAGAAIDFKTDGTPPAAEATIVFSIDPEPSNYPTAFAAAATGSNIKLTWTDAVGEVLPASYLILASSQNNFQLPADGTPIADDPNLSDGVGVMNILQGIQEYTFSGLEEQTPYYFKIFPYNNSGEFIDYKTDGEPPFAEATTATVQLITVLNTTFNADWEGWTQVSVKGAEVWDRNNTFGVDNTPCAKMSGFNVTSNENEDWLISPALDLSNTNNEKLTFFSALGYTGPALNVKISTDYAGAGNPGDATWTDLTEQAVWPTGDPFWVWTSSGAIDISSFGAGTAYIAFVYFSTAQNSATWEIDNVLVNGESGNSIGEPGQTLQANIYPNPGSGLFNIKLNNPANLMEVFSLTGQMVYTQAIAEDQNTIDLTHLNKGIYLVKLTDYRSGAFSTNRVVIN